MLANEVPTIWGDGEQSRDFTFIENVVHANLLAPHAPAEMVSGRVFNIATNSGITLNGAVAILRELTDYSGLSATAPSVLATSGTLWGTLDSLNSISDIKFKLTFVKACGGRSSGTDGLEIRLKQFSTNENGYEIASHTH